MTRHSVLLLIMLALLLLPHRSAQAQVRQCQAADGSRIYTDRKCEDLGAAAFRVPAATSTASAYARRSICARSVQDLADALENAIASGDANRIATLYDWAGMGSNDANRVLNRLQVVAARATAGVQSIHVDAADGNGQLIGLRVDQVEANGHTPAYVSFGLRRRMACWWVHL